MKLGFQILCAVLFLFSIFQPVAYSMSQDEQTEIVVSSLSSQLTAETIPINSDSKEVSMVNVFEKIPYNSDSMGRRKLIDENHLFLMQVALQPNQSVPEHEANSNVNLLVLRGKVVATLNGKDVEIPEGGLLPVELKTKMSIMNKSGDNATFLVIKTPNPSQM